MLARDDLRRAIEAGEVFLLPGLHDGWREQLRGAAYDLRVDDTVWVRRRGSHEQVEKKLPILLDAGDIAVVRSRERFALDWTLAGNLLPKFSMVIKGLHVVHGGLVDPGFGHQRKGSKWEKAGESIVFLVTNISDAPLLLGAKDTILSLQLFRVGEVPEPERREIDHANAFWDEVEHGVAQHLGLQAFQDSRQAQRELKALKARVSDVVMLGWFVLAIAALGAAATVLVALLENAELRDATGGHIVLSVIGVLLLAGLYVALAVRLETQLGSALANHLRERRDHRRDERERAAKERSLALREREASIQERELAVRERQAVAGS